MQTYQILSNGSQSAFLATNEYSLVYMAYDEVSSKSITSQVITSTWDLSKDEIAYVMQNLTTSLVEGSKSGEFTITCGIDSNNKPITYSGSYSTTQYSTFAAFAYLVTESLKAILPNKKVFKDSYQRAYLIATANGLTYQLFNKNSDGIYAFETGWSLNPTQVTEVLTAPNDSITVDDKHFGMTDNGVSFNKKRWLYSSDLFSTPQDLINAIIELLWASVSTITLYNEDDQIAVLSSGLNTDCVYQLYNTKDKNYSFIEQWSIDVETASDILTSDISTNSDETNFSVKGVAEKYRYSKALYGDSQAVENAIYLLIKNTTGLALSLPPVVQCTNETSTSLTLSSGTDATTSITLAANAFVYTCSEMSPSELFFKNDNLIQASYTIGGGICQSFNVSASDVSGVSNATAFLTTLFGTTNGPVREAFLKSYASAMTKPAASSLPSNDTNMSPLAINIFMQNFLQAQKQTFSMDQLILAYINQKELSLWEGNYSVFTDSGKTSFGNLDVSTSGATYKDTNDHSTNLSLSQSTPDVLSEITTFSDTSGMSLALIFTPIYDGSKNIRTFAGTYLSSTKAKSQSVSGVITTDKGSNPDKIPWYLVDLKYLIIPMALNYFYELAKGLKKGKALADQADEIKAAQEQVKYDGAALDTALEETESAQASNTSDISNTRAQAETALDDAETNINSAGETLASEAKTETMAEAEEEIENLDTEIADETGPENPLSASQQTALDDAKSGLSTILDDLEHATTFSEIGTDVGAVVVAEKAFETESQSTLEALEKETGSGQLSTAQEDALSAALKNAEQQEESEENAEGYEEDDPVDDIPVEAF